MKKLFTVLLLFGFLTTYGQFSPILKGKYSLERFNQSSTYVVLTTDDCVNDQLKRHFTESWSLTPVQFILDEEFETFFADASASFVVIEKMKVKGENKLVGAMAIYNGGFTDRKLMYLSTSLAYITYDNYGLEKELKDICKKIPAMVNQLQTTLSLINDQNIQARNAEEMRNKLSKIYNSKAAKLKKKVLLIDKRYKNAKIVSVPELESLYKYDIQFVSSEEIERALANHESGKAVLFSSFNHYKVNKVIDCSTHEIIFCEFEQDDNLTSHRLNQFDNEDIELLNYTVKKAKDF